MSGTKNRHWKLSKEAMRTHHILTKEECSNWRGKKMTDTTKEKMSLAKLGIKKSLQHCINIGNARRGIKMPKISRENHYLWINNRNLVKRLNERNNPEYKQWRCQVLERDGNFCKIKNNDCEGRVVAHHILSWVKYPELRYKINNGITLCQFHHPKKRIEEQKLMPIFQQMNLVEVKTN